MAIDKVILIFDNQDQITVTKDQIADGTLMRHPSADLVNDEFHLMLKWKIDPIDDRMIQTIERGLKS